MQNTCDKCGGKGKAFAKKCPVCGGSRLVSEKVPIDVQIEMGISNCDSIIREKEGEQVPDMVRGDLIFTVKQKTHKEFRRVGNNLYREIPITLEESLLGFSKTIKHLDGRDVKIEEKKNVI
jgi:DnaJ-related protein SCJ1